MNRVTFFLFATALAFAACTQDTPSSEDQSATPSEVSSEASASVQKPTMDVKGFNYLTDCDSLIVSKLVLSGPNGEGDVAYVMGACASGGKTFDVVLVPRTGATPADQLGDPNQVLAKAAENNFEDYICYAFVLPKHQKVNAAGVLEILDLYPVNAVIKRLDNSNWVRLGQDRAEDLSAYNTLRWKILHDNMPQYD